VGGRKKDTRRGEPLFPVDKRRREKREKERNVLVGVGVLSGLRLSSFHGSGKKKRGKRKESRGFTATASLLFNRKRKEDEGPARSVHGTELRVHLRELPP